MTDAGAVYRPELEIVPTALFRDQVTAVFVVPVTAAVNCFVAPEDNVAEVGLTETATRGTRSTVAVSNFVGFAAAVAVIVTDCVEEMDAGGL